jgi:hypothetical protein
MSRGAEVQDEVPVLSLSNSRASSSFVNDSRLLESSGTSAA